MKHRSRTDYAQIYAGDRQGFNLGLDSAIYLRKEATPRVFNAPRIGTQGESIGDTSASTDISGGTNDSLKIDVDGIGDVTATIASLVGLSTGDLIAAALETAINNALISAGYDNRVWVYFDSADDHYEVYSQFTGSSTSVVITAAAANDVAADLLLGVANSGTEAVGTDDQDFLLYTTGGPTFNQPVESNTHRNGRFHAGIIKQKKVAEYSLQTFINMSGDAGDSLDTAVRLLWEQLLGTETVVSSTSIKHTQGLPNFYNSLVRVSTIFGEYYTGSYVRENTVTFPGDGPATCDWSGKAANRVIAGIAQIASAVVASANVIVDPDLTDRYDEGAYVMIVDPDGRTILAGADGSLKIDSITAATDTLTLNSAVSVAEDGFVVPWNPGAVQQTARDNIYTDLEGSFKMKSAGSDICITNLVLTFNNNHNDLDNCFGADANRGFVAGERLDINYAVTFDLSNDNFADVVQASKFEGYDPVITLGATSGRYLKIDVSKWIPAVPPLEVPESGPTPTTLEGMCYESSPGSKDPIVVGWY